MILDLLNLPRYKMRVQVKLVEGTNFYYIDKKKEKGLIGNISKLEIYLTVSFEFTKSESSMDFLILDW